MDTKIIKALHSVLNQFEDRYYIDGDLYKSKVIEDIDKYDEKLVVALLNNPLIKKHYSKNIGEYTVFETNKLIETFEMHDYWMDSHTKYSKKIGLTSNGKFLDESTDVVLDFPYKDTVLKAGMTKEDIEKDDLKPDEPFYNEVIAAEEIDVMLDKKILVNAKKYDVNGVHEIDNFDDEGNLIVKGNNLFALHTLKDNFASKVRFIYIDPPYYFRIKKKSDTFLYNSNFKLSTWLLFMKNRLEIARDLLDNDGVIFVSTNEDGQAYLKVLMDEVFGRQNFIETFIWRKTDNADSLGNKSRSGLEYIHSYEKVKNSNRMWIGKNTENDDAPLINSSNSIGELIFNKGDIKFSIPDGKYLAGKYPKLDLLNDLIVENGVNANQIKMRGKFKWGQEYLNEEVRKGGYFLVKSKLFSIRYQKSEAKFMAPEKMVDTSYLSKIFGVGSYEDSNSHLDSLGIDFTYSKPESLIAFLMRATTEEEDIILDFFMGSATTQAVAMKMNRRFIGIEQMDYINSVSVPRLQKVIEGEQGGVSKDVEWQGGGSFVYVELMEKSQGYIDQIYKAKDREELHKIYQLMLENVDMNFKVDLEALEEILEEEPLLDERKKLLIKVIDKNQLYYNYSEIDDANVRDLISDNDYQFNQSFYKEDDFVG